MYENKISFALHTEGKIPLQGIHHLKDLTPIATAMNVYQDNACIVLRSQETDTTFRTFTPNWVLALWECILEICSKSSNDPSEVHIKEYLQLSNEQTTNGFHYLCTEVIILHTCLG